MNNTQTNLIDKVYNDKEYIGYVFPLLTKNGNGNVEYLISMLDNFAVADKNRAIQRLHEEAQINKGQVNQLNHVLGVNPVQLTGVVDEELVFLKTSGRWGSFATCVFFIENETASDGGTVSHKRFYGMVYELPNGKFVNQHRPYEFDTKMQAAQDLLSYCVPVHLRIVYEDGTPV